MEVEYLAHTAKGLTNPLFFVYDLAHLGHGIFIFTWEVNVHTAMARVTSPSGLHVLVVVSRRPLQNRILLEVILDDGVSAGRATHSTRTEFVFLVADRPTTSGCFALY